MQSGLVLGTVTSTCRQGNCEDSGIIQHFAISVLYAAVHADSRNGLTRILIWI
jgi:hypothetical protein